MRFAVFTHVEHTRKGSAYYGYAPYVREMNLWLPYFKEVEIVAPLCKRKSSSVDLQYFHNRLLFHEIPSLNFSSLKNILNSIGKLPGTIYRICEAMRKADHLHLRCPGNIGLIACICQVFFPEKPKTAKYAGNWDPKAKQPWSYKLQKWILSNTFLTRNMKVLAYGNWPEQSNNILPFFTASFYQNEIKKIEKDFNQPYKFLFVGTLVSGKHPFFALNLIEALKKKNIMAELHVYGDGTLREDLEKQADNKNFVHLHGNQSLEVLKQAYKDSHFLILPSKSEGWPKAVAEAMFFGCVPVVTSISCVPWILNYGERGIIIPTKENRKENKEKRLVEKSGEKKVESPDVLNDTVDKILELIKDPEEMRRMSMAAQEWSQGYTLERFEEEIKKLFIRKER